MKHERLRGALSGSRGTRHGFIIGAIGILDHRSDTDTEIALLENLAGMQKILKQLGTKEALKSYRD